MARLRIDQFAFRRDGKDWKVTRPERQTTLVRIVPDEKYQNMWRLVRRDGSFSDMVNFIRAKDAAFGVAESLVYLREEPR